MAKKKPTTVKPVPAPSKPSAAKPAAEAKPAPAKAAESVKATVPAKTTTETAKSAASKASAGAERRAALRAQQEALAKRARRRRVLTAIGVIIVIAALVAAFFWYRGWSKGTGPGTGEPSLTSTAQQITPPHGNSTDPAQQAWITVPSANTKPDALIVDIQSDYQCPYCSLFENTYAIPLEQLNADGSIVLRLHTRSFLDEGVPADKQWSTRAAMAAACVDVADSSKFGDYNNTIYRNQPQEGVGFTDEQLTVAFTTAVGLTGDALARFNKCYNDRETLDWGRNVEKNNKAAVLNANPPQKYLYGSDAKFYYDDAGKLVQIVPPEPATPTGTASATDTPTGSPSPSDTPSVTATPSDSASPSASPTPTGTQGGIHSTPTMFVNGIQFTLDQLFTSDGQNITPQVPTDSASLLMFLQYIVNQ